MRIIFCYFLLALPAVFAASPSLPDAPADSPVFHLWPDGKMPGKVAAAPEEAAPVGPDGVLRIHNVSQPTLLLVKPKDASKPTPAIIVCPGGGYGLLAYNKEGTEIAAWLSSIGVTAIVLKYRVPSNPNGAFQDIERAVRTVRAKAAEWNIDPHRVGVMGFSAGGHLCARLGTNFATDAYPAIDAIDRESDRPDFCVMIYPAYLEKTQGKEHLGVLAPGLPVSSSVPPTLLIHTEDDKTFVNGTRLYHAALDAASAPNDLIIFTTGGHGYGLRSTKEAKAWPDRCQAWLQQHGIL